MTAHAIVREEPRMLERFAFAGILWCWLLGPAQSVGFVVLATTGVVSIPSLWSQTLEEIEGVLTMGHLAALLGLPLAVVGLFLRPLRFEAGLILGYWFALAAIVLEPVTGDDSVAFASITVAGICGVAFPVFSLTRWIRHSRRVARA